MPTIIVAFDKEKDKHLFYSYLFDEEKIKKRPHVRKSILSIFPTLYEALETSVSKENNNQPIIDEFIDRLYVKHQNDIEYILPLLQILFKNTANTIFHGLSETMNYTFFQNTYLITPSFLTVSTYNNNGANISILNDIGSKTLHTHFVDLFIHEMSHTIFEEKIKQTYLKHGELEPSTHHYLKEIIAPIIVRDPLFDAIREGSEYIYANTQQQLLYITIGGEIYNLVDYCENIFKNGKNNGLTFDDILEKYFHIFSGLQEQINDKQRLFHQAHNGENLNSQEFKNKLIENGYSVPMIV